MTLQEIAREAAKQLGEQGKFEYIQPIECLVEEELISEYHVEFTDKSYCFPFVGGRVPGLKDTISAAMLVLGYHIKHFFPQVVGFVMPQPRIDGCHEYVRLWANGIAVRVTEGFDIDHGIIVYCLEVAVYDGGLA